MKKKPIALVILDGWGLREARFDNAIEMAKLPFYHFLLEQYPSTRLAASGIVVGLPNGFPGNSEVGHLTMGAGRRVKQLLVRIDESIESGVFEKNAVLHEKLEMLQRGGGALHLIGLVSDGGVHSHERHLYALIDAAVRAGIKKIYIHAILDGRDTPPQSAGVYLERLEMECKKSGGGVIASVMGRFYAMDRDENWDRTLVAFDCLKSAHIDTHSTGSGHASIHFDCRQNTQYERSGSCPLALRSVSVSKHVLSDPQGCIEGGLCERSWQEILAASYALGVTDEFVVPHAVVPASRVAPQDGVILFNFRSDRMRQLAGLLLGIKPEVRKKPFFGVFPVQCICSWVISMTQYSSQFNSDFLFEKEQISHTLLDELEAEGKEIFTIAETEKYAHVTYFFSGGREVVRSNERRELVPSLPIHSYADAPHMSAEMITQKVLAALLEERFDFFLINYANADMVGHTGNFESTVKAVECLDEQLKNVYQAFVVEHQGTLFITADHGNAEEMWDIESQAPKTAHTKNPVPLIVVGEETVNLERVTELADIAPLVLHAFGLAVPREMK